MCLLIRTRLSVENPGPFQIILEDGVLTMRQVLEEWIGPKGRAICRSSARSASSS